jgi:hypothetical protein
MCNDGCLRKKDKHWIAIALDVGGGGRIEPGCYLEEVIDTVLIETS